MHTHKASCDRCKYRAGFNDTLCTYRFDDGSDLSIERTFVWCGGCQGIQWGEILPELSELEQRPAEQMSPDLELRIAWRRARVSGPRCLECGATDIVRLEESETGSGRKKWVLRVHPHCGGTITVSRQPVLVQDRGWIVYSPEGE